MQQQSIHDYFLSLTNSNQKLLTAHSSIKHKLSSHEQFILDTIQLLSSQQQPSPQQYNLFFNIVTLIHPSLSQGFSQLNQKIQEDVRGGLLNCVVMLYRDRRVVQALGLLIREIVEVDGLEPWMEPFGELLKWMASEDHEVVEAGIQFFIFILKETEYNQSNSDMPLHKLASPLLQVLYQLFANSQLQQRIREKLLFLVLQLIKTFSIFDGYKDEIVRECFEQTYSIWMSFFTSTLQSTIYSNITIKKYIMKILVIIFRDMQKYLSDKQKEMPAQLYVVWEFCYKMLPLHLWGNVWQKDILQYKNRESFNNQQQIPSRCLQQAFLYYQQDTQCLLSPSESLLLTILQFLSVLTSIPHLNTTIKVSIHHLTNSLFHFMLLGEFQTMFWRNNTQQFLTHNVVSDYQVTIRNKTMGILNQLIEKCGDYAIQAILMVAEKFLLNIPEAHTTESVKEIMQNVIDINTLPQLTLGIYQSPEKLINLVKLSSCDVRQSLHVSGQTWKKMQVALVVLGRFAQDIIVFQSKQQAAFDIESFVKGLIKQVKDDDFYQLLKGQSLYCLTRFTQIISIKYRHLFTQLCLACIQCLSSSLPISVKAISCRALTLFLRKIQKHKLQFSQEDEELIRTKNVVKCLMELPMLSQITNVVLEVLVEACRNKSIGMEGLQNQAYPEYLLTVFHKNVTHNNTIQLFFVLLEEVTKPFDQYKRILTIFINFIQQCLKSFSSIISSQQISLQLKSGDIQLILIVLRITNVLITRGFQLCSQQNLLTSQNKQQISQNFICLIPLFTQIIKSNNDIQIHIQVTICYKNVLKLSYQKIRQDQQLVRMTVDNIKNLLKIPKDKSFQSSAVYAGNLAILAFEKVLPKINYQILQQAVLKVFRSRTPSVIQSLVLIYSRLINLDTDINEPFKINKSSRITDLIDFLSSFSIQNRMGLKILIDKWLLQQSLFRGKYTKISTFMALSKLFLLDDKRIDNLLVIGFNPSHTNVCNDVSSPLKILATLIRCLDNEKGFEKNQQSQEENQEKDQGKVDVNLEKFKEERDEEEQLGGLADRENQQGSTCYMSAMLEFYDDGEECDQTTEDDLGYLNDSATKFVLADYLIEFFNYLMEHKKEHFKECLKGILKQDVKTLSKYVKID